MRQPGPEPCANCERALSREDFPERMYGNRYAAHWLRDNAVDNG